MDQRDAIRMVPHQALLPSLAHHRHCAGQEMPVGMVTCGTVPLGTHHFKLSPVCRPMEEAPYLALLRPSVLQQVLTDLITRLGTRVEAGQLPPLLLHYLDSTSLSCLVYRRHCAG